jgi:hypothetical protein
VGDSIRFVPILPFLLPRSSIPEGAVAEKDLRVLAGYRRVAQHDAVRLRSAEGGGRVLADRDLLGLGAGAPDQDVVIFGGHRDSLRPPALGFNRYKTL